MLKAGIFIFVVIVALNCALIYGGVSVATSIVKTTTDQCEVEWPVDGILITDMFCPVKEK